MTQPDARREAALCAFCDLKCNGEFFTCPRCGGELRPTDAVLDALARARTLLRNRVWHGLTETVKLLQQRFDADKTLAAKVVQPLTWLGQDFEALVQRCPPADYPRLKTLAQGLLPLLPAGSFPQLQKAAEALTAFLDALSGAEKQCKERGEKPVAAKLQPWFAKQVARAGLSDADARACLYANCERWPTVAAVLDPAAFQQGGWVVRVARAERELRDKNYGSARKLFEEVLARNPGCIRALEGLALTLAGSGDLPGAVGRYREAIRAGATDPRTYNNLAWYTCTGPKPGPADLQEAEWAARRAVELAPVAGFWDTLAEALARRGDTAGAIAATREALRVEPGRESFRERMRNLCAGCPMPGAGPPPKPGAPQSRPGDSGIRIGAPCDSGIRLEDDDFADSEFELTLDDDAPAAASPRLRLDDDSEFELSLDEGEAPMFEEESGSQVLPLEDAETFDSDMDSSDFDLACEDEDTSPFLRTYLSAPKFPPARSRGAFEPSAQVVRDPVDCTVFAPPEVPAGDVCLINVFAHLPQEAAAAQAAAREFDPDAQRRGFTSLGTEVARGSKLSFELRMPGVEVSDAVQELAWRGQMAYVSFAVSVPDGTRPGPRIGTVRVSQEVETVADGERLRGLAVIGEIKFTLKVAAAAGPATLPPPVATGEARRFQKAFVSYASPDRTEVCKRVQMLAAAGIKFFQDVLDLEPGQRWERELYRHMDESDVMFLFWSPAAKASEWVEREWQYGLERKGDDFIRPVVLQWTDPPPRLQHLQFKDKVLYLIQAN